MKHKHIHESYQIYGNFQYYYEQNDLAVARFTHLVELKLNIHIFQVLITRLFS